MINFADAELKTLAIISREATDFVEGYLAGSCNSYDKGLETFKAHLEGNFGISLPLPELDTILNEKIEISGIFYCEDCGWWCWEHEASYNSINCCSECSLNEEEDE